MCASRRTGTGACKAFRFGVAAVELEGGSCTSAVDAGDGADADAGVGVEADSGGREIGARRSVETATKPEERGFGLDSITGDGTVGEEATVVVVEAEVVGAAIIAASRSGSGGEDDETSSGSGPGSHASNLPNHSATRPFVADRRRAASSSSSSRLPSLFFFLLTFPSLLLLLTRSLSLSLESDLTDLRDRALYVPRSLLDEAPLP
jgi:hypothetical protein